MFIPLLKSLCISIFQFVLDLQPAFTGAILFLTKRSESVSVPQTDASPRIQGHKAAKEANILRRSEYCSK